jgi:CheY-like chemotaxis protein
MKKVFVVIDDDVTTNFYNKLIISKTFVESEISTFSNPLIAVEYFQKTFIESPVKTIVLLDINMPYLSGWEVLDKIEALNDDAKSNLSTFIVSSSINPEDKRRALNHPLVSGYIEKPLDKEKLLKIFS